MSWKRRLRFLLVGLGVFGVAIYLGLVLTFQIAKSRRLGHLESGSRVVETGAGPIEYATRGSGPVVLFSHGTPGGYDQWRIGVDDITAAGFTFLSVSRPGYLRTPIDTGRTPVEQADAFASLLDSLEIDQVAVFGASGGAPAAIEFARRHGERLWAMVLGSALTQKLEGSLNPPSGLERFTDRIFGRGFLPWGFLSYAEAFPESTLLKPDIGLFNEDSRGRLMASQEKLDLFFAVAWTGYPPALRWDGWGNDLEQFGKLDLGDPSTIQVPTLVVHGNEDQNAPLEGAEWAVSGIAGAELVLIEGGDHYIAVSRPEDVWPPIVEFLGRHAPE